MQNPIDGIVPDFSIFGAEFTELWQKLFAGLWALCIVAAIVFLIVGLVKVANNAETNPQAVAAGKTQVLWASISLGGLVSLGVIVGAIIALVS